MSSSRGIDYSAWDHIYVSDDEDTTSPFVDTASLFRMRHRSRLEQMADLEQRGEDLEANFSQCQGRVSEAEDRLRALQDTDQAEERTAVKDELDKLRRDLQKFEKMLKEHKRDMKKQPWNVDTISKDGFSKTVVSLKNDEETEQEKTERQQTFVETHAEEIRHFGFLHRWEDSQQYLSDHPHLVCEETASSLVDTCISMETDQKHALMGQVAHQAIVMKFILDLAQTLQVDPRGCFRHFFSKIKTADKLYLDAFDTELELMKKRVQNCVQSRREPGGREGGDGRGEEDEDDEEDEEEAGLRGPGGLNPQEVYNTLPKDMQRGFDERNMELLQRAMDRLHPEEAQFHLRRCIDSGLWVPDCGQDSDEEEEQEGV